MCRPKWRGYWPGCRPAPAEAGAEATAKAATEVGGAVWAGRTRRKPIHGGSMAPCSCAPSCAHGKTGVGRPAQPARGHASGPWRQRSCLPIPPPPDSVPRVVDPRHAWMDVPTDFEIIEWIGFHPRMAWIYVSTKVDTHQEQVMPSRQIVEICRRRGGSGCGGVSAMDGATEPTGTYLRRPPQPDPPRHPTECSCCCCC
jgi:hypothetical protein